MRKVMSKKVLAATVAGLAVAGGGAAIAASQNDSPASSFFDSVAKHLGISSEKLEDATKAAAVDQVNAALEEGKITEEQAEELKSRIESGEFPRFFGPGLFGGPGDHHGFGGHLFFGDKLTAAAEYLGLTQDELREALRDGQSLAEVAEAEGKSVDGLKQAILDEAKTSLDEAVADERFTREQADEILERLRESIDDIVNGTGAERWQFRFRGNGPGIPPAFGPPDGDGSDESPSGDTNYQDTAA